MPWENNNGGPWGGGGGSGGGRGGGGGPRNPWGQGGGGGGGGRGPQGPDVEEMVRQSQERLKRFLPGGGMNAKIIAFLVLVAITAWLATGIYKVEPNEQGVELLFGKVWDETGEGLHYNFPSPIGEVLKPTVTAVNKVEVGFRSASGGNYRDVDEEGLMLTGDENIIDYQFVVFWVISDAKAYLFNTRNPDQTVKNAAESAMREIIGQEQFEVARTSGRAKVTGDAKLLIQAILDNYGSGILVTQVELQKVDPPRAVIDAFLDVQRARADKERAINEATAYLNKVSERAQGQAEEVIRAAEAYKEERIAQATGDAQRFLSIYAEYAKAKDITKRRIYLQTMEEILQGMNKVLIENGGADNSTGVLPYLPLGNLVPKAGTTNGGTQ